MAIAVDAITDGGGTDGGSSHTYQHTCTGDDRILFVAGNTHNAGGSDDITGITYNSVAMTRIDVQLPSIYTWVQYLYYLIAPATGENDVVLSRSTGNGNCYGSSISYTGALQSGVPDAEKKGVGAGSPVTTALTSVADNCWHLIVASNVDKSFTASTNTTERISDKINSIFDSNGPKTPAGSLSQSIAYAGTREWNYIQATFAPAPISNTGGFFPLF